MSEQTKDGGPAFPLEIDAGAPGMSLRDWFAGQALSAVGESNPNLPGDPASQYWPDAQVLANRRAVWAYLQAEAMLAARGQP